MPYHPLVPFHVDTERSYTCSTANAQCCSVRVDDCSDLGSSYWSLPKYDVGYDLPNSRVRAAQFSIQSLDTCGNHFYIRETKEGPVATRCRKPPNLDLDRGESHCTNTGGVLKSWILKSVLKGGPRDADCPAWTNGGHYIDTFLSWWNSQGLQEPGNTSTLAPIVVADVLPILKGHGTLGTNWRHSHLGSQHIEVLYSAPAVYLSTRELYGITVLPTPAVEMYATSGRLRLPDPAGGHGTDNDFRYNHNLGVENTDFHWGGREHRNAKMFLVDWASPLFHLPYLAESKCGHRWPQKPYVAVWSAVICSLAKGNPVSMLDDKGEVEMVVPVMVKCRQRYDKTMENVPSDIWRHAIQVMIALL